MDKTTYRAVGGLVAEGGVWPTPRQWIDRWDSADDEKRLEWAERIIEQSQMASDCFVRDHASQIEQARQDNIRLADANAERLHRSFERERALESKVARVEAVIDGVGGVVPDAIRAALKGDNR